MPLKPENKTVKTWSEFVKLAETQFAGRWHFRGVLDNWSLEPSLHRAANDWAADFSELPDIERRMLRDFKRAYPSNPMQPRPEKDDDLGWLALMQHHGAPTRLLDWTYSPFVAAFFALDYLLSSPDRRRRAAVWALSAKPVENEAIVVLLPSEELRCAFTEYSKTRAGPPFRAVFLDANPPVLFATPVNPYTLNERLVVQQGLFICPGDVRRRFDDNLLAVPGANRAANLKRILLPRAVLRDAFADLHRMNITYASLFPGVDGYARRFRHRIGFFRSGEFFDGTEV